MAKPFDLVVGEWWAVPRVGNTHLADVYASPAPSGLQSAIMDAWSGGCFDSSRGDLVIWGGGHTDYAGNEIYAFNVDSLVWRIKNYYSTAGAGDTESASGGGAAARHTYSGLTYSKLRDKMVCAGGVLWGPTGGFDNGCWEFDMTVESPSSFTNGWTQKDDVIALPTGEWYALSIVTADGHIWQRNFGLLEGTLTAAPGSQWNDHFDFQSGPPSHSITCCLIPGSPNRMMTLGLGTGDGSDGTTIEQLVTPWSYDGGGENAFGTSGATIIESVAGPGLDYDSNGNSVVAWGGTLTGGTDNRDVYKLNTATKVWTRVSGTGDTPDNPTGNGTYGRFRYLGDYGSKWAGLFILVNTTTSDVFFYRASPGPALPIGDGESVFPNYMERQTNPLAITTF